MQIKHVPPGLGPVRDCGYQRIPYRPRKGDPVLVQIKVEDAQGQVSGRLEWEQDGRVMPVVEGRAALGPAEDARYLAFDMGPFSQQTQIRYRFVVEDEDGVDTSPFYAFDVLRQGRLSTAQSLYQGEDAVYAVFSQLIMEFNWNTGLRVRVLDNTSHIQGEPVESVHIRLSDDASFYVNGTGWELNRDSEAMVAVDFAEIEFLQAGDGTIHQIQYCARTSAQHIFGLGERFNQVDQKGLHVDLSVVEKFTNQGEYSYIPIPFFITDQGMGWFSSSKRLISFEAVEGITLTCDTAQKGVLYEEWWLKGDPQSLLADLHALTGKAVLPPKWALGIWISANGWNTQTETLEQIATLQKLELPATAIVLEAWSDEHTFCIFNDAEYEALPQDRPYRYEDFTFPEDGKWPNPKAMAEAIRQAGLNLVLWQIPVIKYTPDACEQLQQDEAYAIAKGYCVLNEDGTPYRIPDNWFKGSLILDYTNPEAVEWWFSKRAYLVKDLGVKGFKTDGGEFLFGDTTKTFDGQTGNTAHNDYPMQYVRAYHNFLSEYLDDGITFTRAGHSGAQTVPIHWAGDQLSEWSELRAQLVAGLSAGLSGILFWSFDLGGFAGDFPSSELYLRSTALAAFSPVMQWHSEPRGGQFFYTDRSRWINDRSPWNIADLYDDPELIDIYRLFANLRMNLLPYIYAEANYCAQVARPLMAHLAIAFPNDSKAWVVHDQFMFGRDLLVAPILEEQAQGRSIYLPEGCWHDLFTGATYAGSQVISYRCPLDRIPVFVRDGAVLPVHLNDKGIMGTRSREGGVSNKLDEYCQLAFLRFGGDTFHFTDDLGNELWLATGRVRGRGPVDAVLVIDALSSGDAMHLFGRGLAGDLVAVEEMP